MSRRRGILGIRVELVVTAHACIVASSERAKVCVIGPTISRASATEFIIDNLVTLLLYERRRRTGASADAVFRAKSLLIVCRVFIYGC